jgi:hypothetical protein
METLSLFNEMNPLGKKCARPPNLLQRWISLAFWLLCIWVFVFVLAPMMQNIPAVKILSSYIEESGIDASALYYTEVDEVGESDLAVRNTFRFYLPEQ